MRSDKKMLVNWQQRFCVSSCKIAKVKPPVSCEYMYKQVKLLCKQVPIYIKMKGELNCFICDDNGKSSVEDDLPGKFCCVFKFKVKF